MPSTMRNVIINSISDYEIAQFKTFIWNFYRTNQRDFVWRYTHDPYWVLVSEIMLQQTQTQRIMTKFPEFVAQFPTVYDLARASLYDVLKEWQGLGYNRRGSYLHKTAQIIVEKYDGIVPDDPTLLEALPGIGKATASSIVAFAYNKPTIFIETNIRSVFIHYFFQDTHKLISDAQLMPLIKRSVDHQDPRSWYYALMDYGVYVKKQGTNPNRASVHYTKQSRFQGSKRQIRGAIIRLLTQEKKILRCEFPKLLDKEANLVDEIMQKLMQEKILLLDGQFVCIA